MTYPPQPPPVPATPPAPAPVPALQPPAPAAELGFPPDTPVTGMTPEQAAAYHQHYSRQHEIREKEERAAKLHAEAEREQLAQELAALKAATQTDQEKALEAARAEGRTQALREASKQLVDAHFAAATATRMTDEQRTALLNGLDRSQFMAADGISVDTAKVTAFVDAVAPAATATPPGTQPATGARLDLGQGRHAPAARPSGMEAGREIARQRYGRPAAPGATAQP